MSKLKVYNTISRFDVLEDKQQFDLEAVHCPECGSIEIIRDWERAELVCSECGLVIMESIIDHNRTGKRAYTSEEKNAREHRGAPLSSMLPNYGLTTKIDNNSITKRFKRIKRWHTRLDWPRRNLLIATNEIRRLSALLGIPKSVQEQAAILYRKVFKLQLLRGRSINSFVAACLYISCRLGCVPRTLKEICSYSKSRAKSIRHSSHIIIRELNLKIKALNPAELVSSYCSTLSLSSEVELRALEIIRLGEEAQIILGKDPKGVAAAAIYIACIETGERRSQTSISNATGITEVTLRNRFKELKTIL
ncbi:MAG: transcription initiation factor IIB [Candidatus Helarchaeota archaeon]